MQKLWQFRVLLFYLFVFGPFEITQAVVPLGTAVVPLDTVLPPLLPLNYRQFFWYVFRVYGSRAVVPLDTVLPPLLPLHYRDFYWHLFSLSGSKAEVER